LGQGEVYRELEKEDFMFIGELREILNQKVSVNKCLKIMYDYGEINKIRCYKKGEVLKYAYCILENVDKAVEELRKIYNEVTIQ